MSLSHFFPPEFRPMFRTFEEPYGRPSFSSYRHPSFDETLRNISPAVDVTENPDNYVVHAELPGVQKQNVNVNVGDAGRSLTISGRVVIKKGGDNAPTDNNAGASAAGGTSDASSNTTVTKANTDRDVGHKLYNERTFVADSSFSRTIRLPYPVDPAKVTAKMVDGVLTINLGKLEDRATTRNITID